MDLAKINEFSWRFQLKTATWCPLVLPVEDNLPPATHLSSSKRWWRWWWLLPVFIIFYCWCFVLIFVLPAFDDAAGCCFIEIIQSFAGLKLWINTKILDRNQHHSFFLKQNKKTVCLEANLSKFVTNFFLLLFFFGFILENLFLWPDWWPIKVFL